MSIVAWLVLGLVVIGGAFYLAGLILAGAVNMLASLWGAVVDGLGRKGLGASASIPEVLRKGAEPLPKQDPDRAELSAYDPKPSNIPIPRAVGFSAASGSIFMERPVPSHEVDVERISEMLLMA